MAVATTTHTALQVVRLEERLPLMTGKLASLVGMDNDLLDRLSTPHSHEQCPNDQVSLHTWLHCPPDDTPGEEVQHHGQKQLALMRADIGNVGHPCLIRLFHIKLLLQVVRGYD